MRAVIFDMDGVLVDSEPTHVRVLSGVLAGYGHELTPQIYASLLGVAPYETWDRLAEHFALTGDPQEFLRRYVISVEDALGTPLAPKPGVLELIERDRKSVV